MKRVLGTGRFFVHLGAEIVSTVEVSVTIDELPFSLVTVPYNLVPKTLSMATDTVSIH